MTESVNPDKSANSEKNAKPGMSEAEIIASASTAAETAAPDTQTEARRLIRQHFWGVLSTHSKKFPGYPLGSVVPVCPDYSGAPIILISKLAQHTQNIQHSPQVSLTLVDTPKGNVQAEARASLLADAQAVAAEEVAAIAERYYRYFPECEGYHTELDFVFYRLKVVTVRYIGGFGKIHWLSPGLLSPNPFTAEQEQGIVSHMNEDHADALLLYWQHAGLATGDAPVQMVSMDAESIVVRRDGVLAAIALPVSVATPLQARECLVAMVKAAREAH